MLERKRTDQGDSCRAILKSNSNNSVFSDVAARIHRISILVRLCLHTIARAVVILLTTANEEVFAMRWNHLLSELHNTILANAISSFGECNAAINELPKSATDLQSESSFAQRNTYKWQQRALLAESRLAGERILMRRRLANERRRKSSDE